MAQVAFDRRRINGPEDSHTPIYEHPGDVDQPQVLASHNRKTRKAVDIRPIFLQPGLIDQASGSAYVETERTKIACAVYGPRQSKSTSYNEKGKLNVEVKYTPFSCERRRAPMRDAEDRPTAVAIQQALVPSLRLELLPKSSIDVFLTIIEADGTEGCIASGIVAASAALADAGIEMEGLVMSCAASVINFEIWLDPTEEESRLGKGSLIFSCMPALGTVTSVWQSGQITPEQLFECMELCQERCADIHSVTAQALLDNLASAN